jgi:hypothetical protein
MSFYNRYWNYLGTKDDYLTILHETTNIPRIFLNHTANPRTYSVAQRMSWAAERKTERVEDRAYSLMGLFDVKMNMIYGEREQSFVRLQEHIMQHSADQSIFTWSLDRDNHPEGHSGLLAPSPSSFADGGGVIKTGEPIAFNLSNLGLSIKLPIRPWCIETYCAYLACTHQYRQDCRWVIFLTRLSTQDQYVRVMDRENASKKLIEDVSESSPKGLTARQIYVRQNPIELPLHKAPGFWLRKLELPRHTPFPAKIISRAQTSHPDRMLLGPSMLGTAGIFSIDSCYSSKIRWLKFGFDDEFNPVIMIATGLSFRGTCLILQPAFFDRAAELGPGSAAAADLLTDDWIFSKRYQISDKHHWLKGMHGISILTADRDIGGKYNFIKSFGSHVETEIHLVPDRTPTNDHEGESSGTRLIWAVDFTEVGICYTPEDERDDNCCC